MPDESRAQSEDALDSRTSEVFRDHVKDLRLRTDRMFETLFTVQFAACVLVAWIVAPHVWGTNLHPRLSQAWAGILIGGLFTAVPLVLIRRRPDATMTRQAIAIAQMAMSALLIHLTGGRLETHFHVFVSLAALALYRDRSILLSASAVVLADHFVRGMFFSLSIYGVENASHWRIAEHAFWVAFELTVLLAAIYHSTHTMRDVAQRRAEMERDHQDVEREVLARTGDLRRAEARTRAILETAADGILTFDDAGIVHSFNPAAERMFGRAATNVIGRSLTLLLPRIAGTTPDEGPGEFLPAGENALGVRREFDGQRKNGTTFPLEVMVSESENGEYSAFLRDITERMAVDRMKTEFISTVSHELRTPLTSIRGSLGLVEGGLGGDIPAKAASLIRIAINNSDRLVRLVNDILDIEKIESGRTDFRFERQDLTEIVREAITANTAFADQHDVRFVLDGMHEGAYAVADRDRILQVLTNLLSNAAKFSPEGGKIVVSVFRKGTGIQIEVADRGPGIPAEFRDRIFHKFAQADSSDNREGNGTGLGLSISKALVEKHGGRIGFRAREDLGTVFYIHLPAMITDVVAEPTENPDSSSPRVLVCENDSDVAHLLTLILRQNDLQVDVAANASQVRELLKKRVYDAMTLDLELTGESGLQLLRDLRENPATADLPVVVVSVSAAEESRKSEHEHFNVEHWVQKPIDQMELLRAVRSTACGDYLDEEPSTPVQVLHVEDNADLAYVVSQSLSSTCDITIATSLNDARERIAEHPFDLVLLDLELPDGSGLDLLPILRRDRRDMPVVLFSAHEPGHGVTDQVSASLIKSRTSTQALTDTIASLVRMPSGSPALQSQKSS